MGKPTSGTLSFWICLIVSSTLHTALFIYFCFILEALKHLVMAKC